MIDYLNASMRDAEYQRIPSIAEYFSISARSTGPVPSSIFCCEPITSGLFRPQLGWAVYEDLLRMTQTRILIEMPAFRGADVIRDALVSIAKQDHSEFRVLISVDGGDSETRSRTLARSAM